VNNCDVEKMRDVDEITRERERKREREKEREEKKKEKKRERRMDGGRKRRI